MSDIERLIASLERVSQQIESLIAPNQAVCVDWASQAFRWRTNYQGHATLEAISQPHRIDLDALQNIDKQKAAIMRNTAQFIANKPANNILLTGARGTGKSTLIKACWNHFSAQSLKIIEVDKSDLLHLTDIVELVGARPEKFIIFCDDLSFEEGDASYKTLKSVLDGSISAPTANMLFYATSNRRHLMPQNMRENLDVSYEDGEVRPSDSLEEKISLSERFGLWLSFYPFSQDEYLAAAQYWVTNLGAEWNKSVEDEALFWHRTRGARSGRVAWQFARDYVGRII